MDQSATPATFGTPTPSTPATGTPFPRQHMPSAAEREEQRLIGVMIPQRGTVSLEALVAGGFIPARVDSFIAEGIVERAGVDVYQFCDPLAYFPAVVWTAWRFPGAIIGGLTAAIFYGLTVASPQETELALPPSWRQPIPPEWRVRPLSVPPHLRGYGVVSVAPMAGFPTVHIPMYDRAVAVAQVLATPDHGPEALTDCVMISLGPAGVLPRPVVEAVSRYNLQPMLDQALVWLGLGPSPQAVVAHG